MMENIKRVKLFLFLAVAIVVFLLVVSIVEIVAINKKSVTILNQQEEISKLNNELDYYKNSDSDDKSGDDSIIIQGED